MASWRGWLPALLALSLAAVYSVVWHAALSSLSDPPVTFSNNSASFSNTICAATGAAATRAFQPSGLAPNGTADNTQAIQQAIDTAASAGGGTVSLPAGRYLLNGHLQLKSNVRLTGAGPTTVLKAGPKFLDSQGPDGGFPVLTTSGASNVTISDLTVDQSGNTLLSARKSDRFDVYLVDVRDSHNALIEGVYTRNPFTYSIAVVASSDFCVKHCSTLVTSSGLYNGLDGIHIMDSHTGQVIANDVDQRVGTDGDDGLVAHTIGAPVYDVLYAANKVRGGDGGAGMQLAVGGYPIYDITIRDNDFYGSPIGIHTGYWDTDKAGAVRNVTITGNEIHNLVPSTDFAGGGNAVDLEGTRAAGPLTHITVTANRICKAGAILVAHGSTNKVTGNRVC
jgi:polygalacturonase